MTTLRTRDVDIDQKTAKAWLSILETSGIVYLLPPYHTNVTKRLVKTPKLYFLDTGLCAYPTRWSTPEALEAGAMSGAILETWMLAEIIRGYWHHGLTPPLYFYRDNDQKEVDLLIERDNTLYPAEFKLPRRVQENRQPEPRSLSDLRLIYCAGGKSGPYFPVFSLHRPTMRLKNVKICPRSPTRLATIAQVRQARSRLQALPSAGKTRQACGARRRDLSARDRCAAIAKGRCHPGELSVMAMAALPAVNRHARPASFYRFVRPLS